MDNKLGNTISISLETKEKIDDFDDPYFFVEEWFKPKGTWNNIYRHFSLNNHGDTVETQMNAYFLYLEDIFSDERLKNILSGEEWGFFPFDYDRIRG